MVTVSQFFCLLDHPILTFFFCLQARSASTGLIAAFTKRFPEVKFNLTVDLSKYHDSRADRAFDTSNGQDDGTDVIVLQTVHDFPRWKEANRLLPYKVAPWNDIHSPFRDEDGTFTGCFICKLFYPLYPYT